MRVAQDSRSRVGIIWFDNEAEAQSVADHLSTHYSPDEIAAANLGIIQVGRDRSHDRTVDGQRQYAVVVP